MIISKTPLRLSLFSGGSDLPAFYEQEMGAALNVTINKYIYVMVHEKQPGTGIRLKFDDVETVDKLDDVKHVLARHTCIYMHEMYNKLKEERLDPAYEIASISDVTYNGCGLGSSSAFTVGLINCMSKGNWPRDVLANEACNIEIYDCGHPVGKQDQYAATYGGLNLWRFEPHRIRHSNLSGINSKVFEENLLLVYTGRARDGNKILSDQSKSMFLDKSKFDYVRRNRDRAFEAEKYLYDTDFDSIGDLFNRSWEDKKQISKGITDPYFDNIYQIGMKNGALGGKMLGAGGGGFFLFYIDKEKRDGLISALSNLPGVRELPFKFVNKGSEVVYDDR